MPRALSRIDPPLVAASVIFIALPVAVRIVAPRFLPPLDISSFLAVRPDLGIIALGKTPLAISRAFRPFGGVRGRARLRAGGDLRPRAGLDLAVAMAGGILAAPPAVP